MKFAFYLLARYDLRTQEPPMSEKNPCPKPVPPQKLKQTPEEIVRLIYEADPALFSKQAAYEAFAKVRPRYSSNEGGK